MNLCKGMISQIISTGFYTNTKMRVSYKHNGLRICVRLKLIGIDDIGF